MSFLWVGQVCFNGDGQGARIIVFSIYQGENFYSHSGFLRITNARIFTHQKHWAEIFGIFSGHATECKKLWVFWKRSGCSVFFSCDTHQIAALYHGKRVDFVLAATVLYIRECHWSGAFPGMRACLGGCLFQQLPAPQAGQP